MSNTKFNNDLQKEFINKFVDKFDHKESKLVLNKIINKKISDVLNELEKLKNELSDEWNIDPYSKGILTDFINSKRKEIMDRNV